MRTYRILEPDEIHLARNLVEGLDPGDEYHHFLHIMSAADFDAWERRADRHVFIGCFSDESLIGFAEIAGAAGHAECSLCVDADHRRDGIGTVLFERSCALAREVGAHNLSIMVARGDVEMFDLATEHQGYAVYRRAPSLILPQGGSSTACWLEFDLDSMPAAQWFSDGVRWVHDLLRRRDGPAASA